MATYLLSCECGATVAVGPGQAGGQTVCPRCGGSLAVPRLGELARLPVAEVAAPAGRLWTAGHACLLGGVVTALMSLGAAMFLRAAPPPAFDPATIRSVVTAAPTADIYRAWRGFARSGVARPATPDEERTTQVARAGGAIAWVLLAVAAAAAAVALGGAVALARGRRPTE